MSNRRPGKDQACGDQAPLPMDFHDPPMPDLTDKQKAFCLAYVQLWNASEAYRRTYQVEGTAPLMVAKMACELMADPRIKVYINHLRAAFIDDGIASAKERLRWWTSVMMDESQPIRDRLKASELLAKAQGDFVHERENKPLEIRITGNGMEFNS